MYEQDSLSALDAITEAQRIAFAPMLFKQHSAYVMRVYFHIWIGKANMAQRWLISPNIAISTNMLPAFC